LPLIVKPALAVELGVIPVLVALAFKVTGRSIRTVPPDATVRSLDVGVIPLVV
jgi:hypothetical protein